MNLRTRHGILTWRPTATFYHGALLARSETSPLNGIRIMEVAVEQFLEIGQRSRLPYCLGILSLSLARAGQSRQAALRAFQAIDLAYKQNEQWCLPELLRIQAATTREGDADARDELLRQSIEKSDLIGAMSWKLRSSLDLGSVLKQQGHFQEARRTVEIALAGIKDRFATADITSALDILGTLERPRSVI